MEDRENYVSRLWDALDEVKTGLLGIDVEGKPHALPMTAHLEGDDQFYFFAPAGGRLAEGASSSRRATFYYTGPGHDLFATIHGALSVSTDRDARQRHWTDEVERWFPDQRDSDSVVLLEFRPDEGEIWIPSKGIEASAFTTMERPVDRHAEVTL